jgi:S1-C subfamily serine protease
MDRYVIGILMAFALCAMDVHAAGYSAFLGQPAPFRPKSVLFHTSAEPVQNIGSIRHITDQLDAPTVYSRLSAVAPDSPMRARGAKEQRLYSELSPSVVLVVTKDGIGSGVVVGGDGTILTNWHVVGSNQEVGVIYKPESTSVKLSRKDLRTARVVRVDEVADLALLKVAAPQPLSARPVSLGEMSEVAVGADVHAIGHPTGETWTYTRGIISQIREGYNWQVDAKMSFKADVIQTQTPINPGNSGGPLLTDSGKLVGINSFKAEGEALNFAVAVSEIRRFLSETRSRHATKAPAQQAEQCELVFGKPSRNKTKDGNIHPIDVDCDDQMDGWIVVFDDPSEPVVLAYNLNENNEPKTVVLDKDRDGKWDISFYDINGDGKPDLVGHHPDGEIVASSFEIFKG